MPPHIMCITPGAADLGESLHWDAAGGVLYWIDAWKTVVHACEPATGEMRQTDFAASLGGRPIGSVACCSGGGMISGVRGGFYRLDLDRGDAFLVAAVETDRPVANRLNDGKWTGLGGSGARQSTPGTMSPRARCGASIPQAMRG
jgi:sugar lactone lactonase YvrE